jgi:hypothetical protein
VSVRNEKHSSIDTTLSAISCGIVHPHANAWDTRDVFSKFVLNGHSNGTLTTD